MSLNLVIGDMVAGKSVVELGVYYEALDLLPVKFEDGKYAVYCCGSVWLAPDDRNRLLGSYDNKECNRLLDAAVTMPEVGYGGTERFVVDFERRAGFLRGFRHVRLAFYHGEKKDRDDRPDEVLKM